MAYWQKIRALGFLKKQHQVNAEVIHAWPNVVRPSPLARGEASKIFINGKHSYGWNNIKLLSWGEGANLYIGSFCSIGGNLIVFLGGNHLIDWATTFLFGHIYNDEFPAGASNGEGHPSTKGHIIIENDVWIGEGATLLSGVTIGSGSIVATKSVVAKDVKPYTIVAGNPAREIRPRFAEPIIQSLLEIKWWDRSDSDINAIVPLLQSPICQKTLSEIKAILGDM
jgi:acetyltransferase-like isoleucine patch superfamily enzyme